MKENYSGKDIYITGNTVIDALHHVIKDQYKFEDKILDNMDFKNKKVILLTSHRRENLGEPMENIFRAVNDVTTEHEDLEVVFPIHLNPKVREIAKKVFANNPRVHLIEPLDYEPFANLINKSYLVVTDSGGLQEEAPSLGKPVLVVREETERPEGVEAGTCKLLGTSYENLYKNLKLLIEDEGEYKKNGSSSKPLWKWRCGKEYSRCDYRKYIEKTSRFKIKMGSFCVWNEM